MGQWCDVLDDFFGLFGDQFLEEPLFLECHNRSDLSSFVFIFVKNLLDDLIRSLSSQMSSAELTAPQGSTRHFVEALQSIKANTGVMLTVMIPLTVQRFGHMVDHQAVADVVQKKQRETTSQINAKLAIIIAAQVKGQLAALCQSLSTEKQGEEDAQYFEGMLSHLQDGRRLK